MKWETQHRSSSGFSSCLFCLRAPVSGPSGSKCRMLPRPPWGERGRASWLCRHVAPGGRATPRCIYGRLLRGAVWEPGPDVTGTCPPPLAALVHLPQEDPGASSLPQDPEGLEAGLLGPLPHALAHGPQGTAWVSRAGSRGTGVLGRQQPHTQSPVPGPRLRTGLGSSPPVYLVLSSPAKRAAIISTGLRGESRSQKTRCCSRHFPGPRDIQVLGCDSAPAAGPAGSGGAHFSIWFCALHWTAPHATSPSLQPAPRPASAGLALVWVAPAPPRCSLPDPGLSPTVAPGSRDGLGRAPSSVGVGAVHELPPRVRGARARRVPGAVSF